MVITNNRKIKAAFTAVKSDIQHLHYEQTNHVRYLQSTVREQAMRIRELERRLAQVERLQLRSAVIGEDYE